MSTYHCGVLVPRDIALQARRLAAVQAESATTIGIRPEHEVVTDDSPQWRGIVSHLEYLGSGTFLFATSLEIPSCACA